VKKSTNITKQFIPRLARIFLKWNEKVNEKACFNSIAPIAKTRHADRHARFILFIT